MGIIPGVTNPRNYNKEAKMENKVINLVTKLDSYIKDYLVLSHKLKNKGKLRLKPIEVQKISIQVKTTRRNILHTKHRIQNLLNVPILEIRYTLNGNLHEARLANMTQEEARTLLEYMASKLNRKLVILEIKEISTYISNVPL